MYVCMYECMYACMYVCIYVCMCVCVNVCLFVCMYVCIIYVCVHAYMYVSMFGCMQVGSELHMYEYIHIRIVTNYQDVWYAESTTCKSYKHTVHTLNGLACTWMLCVAYLVFLPA